jgi:hypothetical protein
MEWMSSEWWCWMVAGLVIIIGGSKWSEHTVKKSLDKWMSKSDNEHSL